VLPRKELFESWEVAKRARGLARGARIADLAAGHGLLAHLLLIMDRSAPGAICVDARKPASAEPLSRALTAEWPELAGRIEYLEQSVDDTLALTANDVIVSVHACGALTDAVLDRALAARAPVAVLPCCQEIKVLDTGGLEGWVEGTLAIDIMRAARLSHAGYRVKTVRIDSDVTPKNRLLLGVPSPS